MSSGLKLSPEIIKSLSNSLSHLVENPPQRQELLRLSFGTHQIISGVSLEGASTTFLVNLISYLYGFGEIDGKNALVKFIETASEKVGDDKKEELYIQLGQLGYEKSQSQHKYMHLTQMSMTLNSSFSTMTSNERRLLSLFDIGFYGTNLVAAWEMIEIAAAISFDHEHLPDIIELIRTCGLLLLSKDEYENLNQLSKKFLYYLYEHEYPSDESYGLQDTLVPIAKKIERIVLRLVYSLSKKEAAAFVLGDILGLWYFTHRKLPDQTRIRLLETLYILSSDEKLLKQVEDQIDSYREDAFPMTDPVKAVYGMVRHLIMFAD